MSDNEKSYTTISSRPEINKNLYFFLSEDNNFQNVIMNFLKDKEYIYKENNKYRMKVKLANVLDCSSERTYYEFDILNVLKNKKIKVSDLNNSESFDSLNSDLSLENENENEDENENNNYFKDDLLEEINEIHNQEIDNRNNLQIKQIKQELENYKFRKPSHYKNANSSSVIYTNKNVSNEVLSDSELEVDKNTVSSYRLWSYITTLVNKMDDLNISIEEKNSIIDEYKESLKNQFIAFGALSLVQFMLFWSLY